MPINDEPPLKITTLGAWILVTAFVAVLGIVGSIEYNDTKLEKPHPKCYVAQKCGEDEKRNPVHYGRP